MRRTYLVCMFAAMFFTMCAQESQKKTAINNFKNMEFNKLTPEEESVILHKGTEGPYTGEYLNYKAEGVFTAYFASGCFWGTEYFFMKAPGVKKTSVGFMGGHVENPTYEQVCQKNTGHLETTEVIFDPAVTSYEEMVKLFFETHDFTQTDGQGPDIGPQYRSCIFYADESQKAVAEKYIHILHEKGYRVATMLKPATTFWKAEDYHQQYYAHKGTTPYCHKYTKIFRE